jgi:hypothetical protein
MQPAFQKRIVHRQPICQVSKPARLPLAGSEKLLEKLREICHPTGAKGFELASFKKLSANSKAFALSG